MKYRRILPLLLAAVIVQPCTALAAEQEVVSAPEEERITPSCQTTLYYTAGIVNVHFDSDLSGAVLSIFRSQPEGEFLYYTYDTGLAADSVMWCELIEGDYKLLIELPAQEGQETECFTVDFKIADPDMDEAQSFDMSELDIGICCDPAAGTASLEHSEAVLVERMIEEKLTFTLPRRHFSAGDMEQDGNVDASDAAAMLIDAAQVGAGESSAFSAMQAAEADLNCDGKCDAEDAAIVLQYAAEAAAGNFTDDMQAYARDKMQKMLY